MTRLSITQVTLPASKAIVYCDPTTGPIPPMSVGKIRCEGVAPSLSGGYAFYAVQALIKPWSSNGNLPPNFDSEPEGNATSADVDYSNGSYRFVKDTSVGNEVHTNWRLHGAECKDSPGPLPKNSVCIWHGFRGGILGFQVIWVREIIDFEGERTFSIAAVPPCAP